MDYHWGIIITLSTFGVIMLIMAYLKLWNQVLFILGVTILILVFLKYLVKFSMTMTLNSLIIKKTLFGIPYLTLEQHFDNVSINKAKNFLVFQTARNKITIENHVGFEIDCLLISKNNRDYECGDGKNADKVFAEIITGLKELKVEVNESS